MSSYTDLLKNAEKMCEMAHELVLMEESKSLNPAKEDAILKEIYLTSIDSAKDVIKVLGDEGVHETMALARKMAIKKHAGRRYH